MVVEKENPIEDPDQEMVEEDTENNDKGLISGEFIPKRGCLKGCLVPIFIIFIVLAIIGLLANSKREIIRYWIIKRIINNTEKQVLNDLPKNMDKKTVSALFETVKNAYKEGKIDEKAMESAINEYIENTRNMPSPEMKKDEIEKLMNNLSEAMKSD